MPNVVCVTPSWLGNGMWRDGGLGGKPRKFGVREQQRLWQAACSSMISGLVNEEEEDVLPACHLQICVHVKWP